jgi:ComF family protein
MAFGNWISGALQLIYPGRCLLCGEELPPDGPLLPVCSGCLRTLDPVQAVRRCQLCSLPLISEQEMCVRCRGRNYAFRRNISIFEYRGAARELIYQFKFRNRIRVAPVLAAFFRASLEALPAGTLLVPVPGNPLSVRARGWDPMCVIGDTLSRSYGYAVRRLLARRSGAAQKSLSYEERRSNLAGRLRIARAVPGGASRVILLDDVFTTGATASECARVIAEAGVEAVEVLSLAIDVP